MKPINLEILRSKSATLADLRASIKAHTWAYLARHSVKLRSFAEIMAGYLCREHGISRPWQPNLNDILKTMFFNPPYHKFLKILLVFVIMIIANGCWAPYGKENRDAANAVRLGPAKVVIMNSSEGLLRHIWVFSGSDQVRIIQDPATKKQGLDRRPIAEFKVNMASSARNWHEYVEIYLPKNGVFTIYEQAERFWGAPVGRPNTYHISTTGDPFGTTCRPVTPSMSTHILASNCIQLPYVDSSSVKPLNLTVEINPGLYIKKFVFDSVEAVIDWLRKNKEK